MSEIKELLQQEVDLMREILSTLMLEERALMAGERELHKQLMGRRQLLKRKLFPLRRQKMALEPGSFFSLYAAKRNQEEEEECELYSLHDQLSLLSEKIKQQQLQNRSLFKNGYLPSQEEEALPPKPSTTTLDEDLESS